MLPPWEHALPIFAVECAFIHRDLYAERRDEYSPDLQAKLAPGFELPAVDLPGALGRGRRLAAALRSASCTTTCSSPPR